VLVVEAEDEPEDEDVVAEPPLEDELCELDDVVPGGPDEAAQPTAAARARAAQGQPAASSVSSGRTEASGRMESPDWVEVTDC
jgi:hypothetical protein